MRRLSAVVAAAVVAAVLPAAALASPLPTYDAFTSFTGTSTGGAFTYGVLDTTAAFTPYDDTAGCAAYIAGTTCTSNGGLPGAFKTTGGAHLSGTVEVPADALILHPGPNAGEASAIVFTAPATGIYRFSISAFIADTSPSGVNIVAFLPGSGFALPVATLDATHPGFTTPPFAVGFIPAGLPFGLAVDYDGNYSDDATGINFTVTQIPEPAAWTLMIAGFALVGVATRRRGRAVRSA